LIDHIDALRTVMRRVKATYPFYIDAMVALPDHLHAMWKLPEGDRDYSTRWALIKAGFSRCLPKGERRTQSRIAKDERGIWQRRFWEHLIRNEWDYARHADYIHHNPIKHSYVKQVNDWPYSTFHRFVARGIYPAAWGGGNLKKKRE
jgi:putative transposase